MHGWYLVISRPTFPRPDCSGRRLPTPYSLCPTYALSLVLQKVPEDPPMWKTEDTARNYVPGTWAWLRVRCYSYAQFGRKYSAFFNIHMKH